MARTAFKDNSSHYQLNGRKIPLKEMAALLRKSGIDLDHNRFLILQVWGMGYGVWSMGMRQQVPYVLQVWGMPVCVWLVLIISTLHAVMFMVDYKYLA